MTTVARLTWASRLRWVAGGLGFVVGVVALMLWLTGTFHRKADSTAASLGHQRQADPDASTAEAEVIRIPLVETASGSIEASSRADVAAKLLAKVVEVRVAAGQRVTKDEPIVILDDADLKARVGQAEASVAQARASFDQWKLEQAQIEAALQGGAATTMEAERARNKVREAEAALERTTRSLEEANTILSYAIIRSPMDGVVVDKRVQPGDTVVAGQSVASVYDPTKMQLVASVRESLASGLRVGNPITVRIDAMAYECSGLISEIVPQAEAGSRSFQVKVTGPCPEGIYAGMFGRLILPLGEEEVLVIPSQAVQKVGQLDLVEVVHVEGGSQRLSKRAVRLGREVGPMVEVLSGLRAGERVLLTPAVSGSERGRG